ncbi:unnamed protein product [Adineta steineri]|uniref:Uncharacterized protein n=1 Tax=Adineta steineri TaxID=433720 RepID=A0A815ENT7_9BILA|nr:unnamed protein product [Adineta steineri]CAF1317803.1 unnamed protein product [Adineta steineri]CAF3985500.1 unnamed protein product [Adineta steineri]CAF4013248.1 unnamed protein product [Adineta steineri]CAF4238863.1 unnamed protein product [Adineta steineri]
MSSHSSYNTYSNTVEYYYNPYNYSTYYPAVDGTMIERFYYVDGVNSMIPANSKTRNLGFALQVVRIILTVVRVFVPIPIQIPGIGN